MTAKKRASVRNVKQIAPEKASKSARQIKPSSGKVVETTPSPTNMQAIRSPQEPTRMMDLSVQDRILRPRFSEVVDKMLNEGYRVRIKAKRDLMSLYKAFERLKRQGKTEGMWTRKIGVSEWLTQARQGEDINPLSGIERNYDNPNYNYGLWKGLATKMETAGNILVATEEDAKRVTAAFRLYFNESKENPEYAPPRGTKDSGVCGYLGASSRKNRRRNLRPKDTNRTIKIVTIKLDKSITF